MRVLVAGGTGFIGRATVKALVEAGHDVVVIGRAPDERGFPSGVKTVAADVGDAMPSAEAVGSIDAIVNLIGIARREGDNTFERAHVHAVRHLVSLAHALGCLRFVHVSVVRVPGARGRYFETKARGEGTVEGSGLHWTILRPGLVYGEGDQALTQIIRFTRLAAIFPVPGGRPGSLQVVDVRDVAAAVVACLDRPATFGRCYDIVGPRRYAMAELVREVGSALGLTVLTPAIPRPVMRLAAESMQLLLPDPPMTRTQLGMLVAGLYGDPAPARRDLDLAPDALSPQRIRALDEHVGSTPSLRLVTGHDQLAWLRAAGGNVATVVWFAALALGLLLALPFGIASMWTRMAAAYLVLLVLAAGSFSLPWRDVLRFTWRRATIGLAFAAVMFGGAQLVIGLLGSASPAFLDEASQVYAWADTVPLPLGLAALLAIVVAEDLVWRGAITYSLAGRLGPWPGAMLAGVLFGLAHLSTGPPVLWLAAWLAGTLWSILAVRTRSLVPVMISHASWDVAMLLTGL